MIKIWWHAIRPHTLLASIGPILLASALASQHQVFSWLTFTACLTCALLLQISVNLANDLFDGLSGVDNHLRQGPKRALHSGLVTRKGLTKALLLSTLCAVLSGLYLIHLGGWIFFLLGVFCLLGVFAYSAGPLPLASHALGELAVFIFFGLIAVIGCFYLHSQFTTTTVIGYAVISGLFSAALMLVNNIRDIDSDTLANKRTLAVLLGDLRARRLYKVIIVVSLLLHLVISYPNWPVALLPVLFCLMQIPSLLQQINQAQQGQLNQLLKATAKFGFIYALTLSLTLLLFN